MVRRHSYGAVGRGQSGTETVGKDRIRVKNSLGDRTEDLRPLLRC